MPRYCLWQPKCMTCYVRPPNVATWNWQPFGPAEILTFNELDSWFKEWPAIHVCDDCKARIEAGLNVYFNLDGDRYGGNKDAGFSIQVYQMVAA